MCKRDHYVPGGVKLTNERFSFSLPLKLANEIISADCVIRVPLT